MHIHILLCTSFKEAYWSSLLVLVETHQPFLLLFSYIRALVGTFHSFVGQRKGKKKEKKEKKKKEKEKRQKR